ncbi:MAG: DUF6391 domain-containing protein [Dehalococcoidia bacterium]|nr:DUF6391 domain-containing protein [Dehalococcoidia bacterium]
MIEALLRHLGAVRRNHALEHATIAVLLSRVGRPVQLLGRASADGFYIVGRVGPEDLRASVLEALTRLRRGETYLAISPLCGTNLSLTGVLTGLAAFLVTRRSGRWERLPQALLAAMLATVVAQPLGRLAQRHITTCADMDGLEVLAVESVGSRLPVYKVRTAWRAQGGLDPHAQGLGHHR